ncbi:S46 family peptidase, partial [Bacteroidota bacterium]
MKIFQQNKLILLVLLPMVVFMANCSGTTDVVKKVIEIKEEKTDNQWFNPDTVKAGRFDTGKMWTFEDAPVDYFDETYNFKPSPQWLDKVRLSSLRFATWCSASFVSEDGLIMTNHHCVDFILNSFEEAGEDIPKNGFYAPILDDERRVPNLFVDQLVLIKNVTDEVVSAINAGKTEVERLENRNNIIEKIQNEYSKETGLRCQVTSLYNGGKYSLYGYRRYNDVRVVMVVERIVGLYG